MRKWFLHFFIETFLLPLRLIPNNIFGNSFLKNARLEFGSKAIILYFLNNSSKDNKAHYRNLLILNNNDSIILNLTIRLCGGLSWLSLLIAAKNEEIIKLSFSVMKIYLLRLVHSVCILCVGWTHPVVVSSVCVPGSDRHCHRAKFWLILYIFYRMLWILINFTSDLLYSMSWLGCRRLSPGLLRNLLTLNRD